MATQRNNYSAEFKAKVALEALKEQQTLAELGSCYGVHPTLVAQWKRQLREALPQVFADRRQQPERGAEALQAQLYQPEAGASAAADAGPFGAGGPTGHQPGRAGAPGVSVSAARGG